MSKETHPCHTISKFTHYIIILATVPPPPSHPPAWSGSSVCGRSGRCPPGLVWAGFGRCASAGLLEMTVFQSVAKKQTKNPQQSGLSLSVSAVLFQSSSNISYPHALRQSVTNAYSHEIRWEGIKSNLNPVTNRLIKSKCLWIPYEIYFFNSPITLIKIARSHLTIRVFNYLYIDISLRLGCCLLVHQEENWVKCIWY